MTGRTIAVTAHGSTIIVRGNAKLLLDAGGFRGIYTDTVRGWLLDRHRLPDLLAYLDSRRVAYVLTDKAGDVA